MNNTKYLNLALVVRRSLLCVPLCVIALGGCPALAQRQGGFLYVANFASNNISGYSVSSSTGALIPIPGSPFLSSGAPVSIVVDPSGQFAYVANQTGNVSAYTIDSATGALTAVPQSPFATGFSPSAVTVDPSGQFVYVVNMLSNNISTFTIDTATGALTQVPGSPFPAGSQPREIAIDPMSGFVYVVNQGSNNISAYVIASTGALAPIRGSPFAAEGLLPRSLAVDPGGQFVYVANSGSSSVSGFTIGTKGELKAIPGSPFAVGSGAFSVALDPSGQFLYSAGGPNNASSTSTWIIKRTGAPSSVCGSPFRLDSALGPTSLTVHASGQFVYVTNSGSNDVSAYAINGTNGALTPVPGSPFPTGSNPLAVTTTAAVPFAGLFVLGANGPAVSPNNTVNTFGRNDAVPRAGLLDRKVCGN